MCIINPLEIVKNDACIGMPMPRDNIGYINVCIAMQKEVCIIIETTPSLCTYIKELYSQRFLR